MSCTARISLIKRHGTVWDPKTYGLLVLVSNNSHRGGCLIHQRSGVCTTQKHPYCRDWTVWGDDRFCSFPYSCRSKNCNVTLQSQSADNIDALIRPVVGIRHTENSESDGQTFSFNFIVLGSLCPVSKITSHVVQGTKLYKLAYTCESNTHCTHESYL